MFPFYYKLGNGNSATFYVFVQLFFFIPLLKCSEVHLPLYLDSICACKILSPGTTMAGSVLERTKGGGRFLFKTFTSALRLISSVLIVLQQEIKA